MYCISITPEKLLKPTRKNIIFFQENINKFLTILYISNSLSINYLIEVINIIFNLISSTYIYL